jgi:hypothetical protein
LGLPQRDACGKVKIPAFFSGRFLAFLAKKYSIKPARMPKFKFALALPKDKIYLYPFNNSQQNEILFF